MNMPPSQFAKNFEPINTALIAQPSLEIDSEQQRISLLLTLDSTKFMDETMVEQLEAIEFTPKVEFHVTAFDIKSDSALAELFGRLSLQQQTLVIDALAETQSQPWQVNLLDKFYILEKQYDSEESPRRSIIQMANCRELVNFYASLNLLMGDELQFETPPIHVTIATQGSTRGIGVGTKNELSDFGTPYSFPQHSAVDLA